MRHGLGSGQRCWTIAGAALLWAAAAPLAAAPPHLSIAADGLAEAVGQLSRQTGVEVLIAAAPPAGRYRLRGRLSAGAALRRLVRGRGLIVRSAGPGRYVIAPAPPPPAPPAEPESVTVQARRIDEAERDVPISMTVLGPGLLGERQIRRLDDLAVAVPGLVATSQINGVSPLIAIRGQRRPVGDDLRLPVITYFAGIALPNEGSLIPLYDLASVQVLRGPQGTVFGRNATGGALLLDPAAPGAGDFAELTIGSYRQTILEGGVDLVRGPVLSARLSGQRARRRGFVRDLANDRRLDDVHSDAARLLVDLRAGAALSQRVTIDWLAADEAGVADIVRGVYPNPPAVVTGGTARLPENAPFFDCGTPGCDVDAALADQQARGVRSTRIDVAQRARRRLFGVAADTKAGEGPWRGRLLIGYRQVRADDRHDVDGTPLAIRDFDRSRSRAQTSAEVQLLYRAPSGRLDGVAGAIRLVNAPDGDNVVLTGSTVTPAHPRVLTGRYERLDSRALFGELHWRPFAGRSPRATIGLRRTWDRIADCTIAPPPGAAAGRAACTGTLRIRSAATTWTLGLDARVAGGMAYLTIRRAYRPAGLNTPRLAASLAAYQAYRPETLHDAEIGWKADGAWAGLPYALSASLFTGRYRDIQRAITLPDDFDGDRDPLNDATAIILNAARARVSGAEAAGRVMPAHGLTLSLSGTLAHARYSEFAVPPAYLALVGADPKADRFSYLPRWTLAAGARYETPAGGGTAHASINARAQARIWYGVRRDDDYGIQPSYGVIDAEAGWAAPGGALSIALFARNLLDRTYAIGGGATTPAITTATLIYAAPRTIGLRARRGW
ncbi:MAG: TonB-dependent receptor [Sphingomonas fennica]